MKLLVKITKNSNVILYSDLEEKGKGKRMKKPNKYVDDFDKENDFDQKNKQSTLPPLPKLTNVNKSVRVSQSLPDKKSKRLKTDKVISSFDNNKQQSNVISHEKHFSYEMKLQDQHDIEYEDVKSLKENPISTETRKSKSAIISEEIHNPQKYSSSSKQCKLRKDHKCTYISKEKVTLESLTDAVCYLNAEMSSTKFYLRKMDKNMESFLEMQTTIKDRKIDNLPTIQENTTITVLDEFPLKTLDELNAVERRLKKDKIFYSNLVNALHSAVVGESIQRKVNSVLRMIMDNKLASLFNWKGQCRSKLKLSKRPITKKQWLRNFQL